MCVCVCVYVKPFLSPYHRGCPHCGSQCFHACRSWEHIFSLFSSVSLVKCEQSSADGQLLLSALSASLSYTGEKSPSSGVMTFWLVLLRPQPPHPTPAGWGRGWLRILTCFPSPESGLSLIKPYHIGEGVETVNNDLWFAQSVLDSQ